MGKDGGIVTAKPTGKPTGPSYGDVVAKLEDIVKRLEAGDLSLEDSLERFAEGVGLVKQGEALLANAERRVEQLLSEEGRTAALPVSEAPEPARPSKPKSAPAVPTDDEDVPF
jgi:exodeoxyribonuclease VII small subunit